MIAPSHEPGVALLGKLLELSERSPARTRPASLPPNYGEFRTADAASRFQAQMAAAERAGAIVVKKGKRERKHLIERVVVADPLALARHLGRSPSNVQARDGRLALEPSISGGASWLPEILDEIERRWARGEAAYRLPPGDITSAKQFLILLAAISTDRQRGFDARTFSLRTTGDSKAFDRHATRLAPVMAVQLGEPRASLPKVWQRLGLDRFAHPIHLRGPIVASNEGQVLIDAFAKPFVSIHPEMLPNLSLQKQPSLLLTIENFTTFNRYVREIEDNGLIVYTGGFPSAGLLGLLKWILGTVGNAVPFFHWGDIDPGGVKIFHFLEENLPRKPNPHLMERSLAEISGQPAARDPSLSTIAKSDSALATLAEWLTRGRDIKHLEQEALDPASPLTGHLRKKALR
jgi:hypothetical protein